MTSAHEKDKEFFNGLLANLQGKLTEEKMDKIAKALPEIFASVSLQMSNELESEISKSIDDRIKLYNDERVGFEKHICELWKKPFDLLDVFIHMSREFGEQFNEDHRKKAVDTQNVKFDALTKIHARACLTSFSIMAQMRAGFPDTAHATWRTLHELAVAGILIKDNERDTADRYLLHNYWQIWKTMDEHKKATNIHHVLPCQFTDEEYDYATRIKEKLSDQFGQNFCKPNGWASNIKLNGVPIGRAPKFLEMEKIAGLDHLRPYYKLASFNVHLDSRGSDLKMGSYPGQIGRQKMLAGSSVFGMPDPGHSTAISLLQVTNALILGSFSLKDDEISFEERSMNAAILAMLTRWVEKIGTAFMEVNDRLIEAAERETNRVMEASLPTAPPQNDG